jgi:histidinol phosphatase-like enzyme
VVERAFALGLPVRCLWLDTGVEQAQVNAATRMVARYGRLLEPEEMRKAVRTDPGAFPPGVQFRHQRELEPPRLEEGFSRVEIVPFTRRPPPTRTGRAVVVWCDGILAHSRSGRRAPSSADDVLVPPSRASRLRRCHDEGFTLLGLAWRPEIAEGVLRPDQVEAAFARMKDLLDLPIEVLYCPHGAGPPQCWCRKPLPGLGVLAIERHALDPKHSFYVGQGTMDQAFARRLGFEFRDAEAFFAAASTAPGEKG